MFMYLALSYRGSSLYSHAGYEDSLCPDHWLASHPGGATLAVEIHGKRHQKVSFWIRTVTDLNRILLDPYRSGCTVGYSPDPSVPRLLIIKRNMSDMHGASHTHFMPFIFLLGHVTSPVIQHNVNKRRTIDRARTWSRISISRSVGRSL